MLWLDEWTAWSARLTAAVNTMQLIRVGVTTDDQRADMHQAENQIAIPELLDLYQLLDGFRKRFASQLPSDVEQTIEKFTRKEASSFKKSRTPGLGGGVILAALLCKVKAEVDYFLADKQVRARRAAERAFIHLQSSIMADSDFRRKWMMAAKAKNAAEPACERLGAAHLLLHGIWAFKANREGGRTDLILSGSIKDDVAVRAADAMVLTEWKRVRKKDNPAAKALEAFSQAEDYTRYTMAGFELSSHGYLVLVSDDLLTHMPAVPSPAKRVYEIINIAVNPASPSKRSKVRAAAIRRASSS